MTSKASGSNTTKEGSTQLKLSDVIRIVAPDNQLFNLQLFFIDYIDEERINLVNMDTMDILKLRIHEGGVLGDGTIQEIVVVSRAPLEGYARQHGLVVGKWIDVYFDGSIPMVITGEITNLESDMIEVRTYNEPDDAESDYLYFNFDYKGLPQNVMVNRIELRPAPEVALSTNDAYATDTLVEGSPSDDELEETRDDLEEFVEQDEENKITSKEDFASESDDSDLEEGEIREDPMTRNKLVANKTILGEYIITAKQRNIGASLDEVETLQRVDKEQERHTLTAQTDDLLDDLIMKQTDTRRGFRHNNSLAIEVERFIQLRESFSLMDKYFNVTGIKTNTDDWKPVVEDIVRMRHPLIWVVPVTKNVRNIYDIPVPDDEEIVDIHSLELMDEIESSHNANERAYMSGTNNDVVNKYRQYMSSLASAFSPFNDPNVEDRDIITMIDTPVDQYSITNNLTNFKSSCISCSTSGVSTTRMVKQQYLAPTRLMVTRDPNMNNVERTHRVSVSMGDRMAIRSIMTLPYSVARFSMVSRPGSSIAQKAQYTTMYPTYFKTLGRKTNIHTVMVDSLTVPSRYNSATYNNFTNYQMGPDMADTSFDEYTRAIIPTTKQLVDMLSDKVKDKLNTYEFITLLEPYSVYTEDITQKQYSDIKQHVNKNISRYLDEKNTRWKTLARIKKMPHSNQFSSKSITSLYADSSQTALAYQYNQAGLNYSNSELLSKMCNLDYGRALTDVMSRESSDILIHEKVDTMMDIFREDLAPNKDTGDKKENENKCKMAIIAKQYFSQEELNRDNKTTIYFDRKYDDTNYTMLIKKKEPFANTIEKFDAQYSQMSPENFFTFVRSKVHGAQPNSVSDADIDHLTETLITGKKRVRDGEYALLHDSNESVLLYFKRINDTWKIDDQISSTLLTDNAALNCSLEPGCVYNQSAMSMDEKCTPVSESKALMHANILKEIINRFDEKLTSTAQELKTYLAERVARSQHLTKVLKTRRTYDLCKYDLQQFAIGAEMVASGVAQVIVQSPRTELKQKILAQKDLNNKYTDLLFFINRYTEECVDGDKCDADGNARRWRYCKITKTRLLPVFMHELALAWMDDGSDYARKSYQHTLQRIIRENGAESDDGAHWVDKFSGEKIVRKDFDTEEGFDNGHKIVSRAVAEESFDTRYLREIRSAHDTVVKYTTHETNTMYKVVTAIAGFMDISLVNQMEFIIKIASTMMTAPNILPSEAKYREIVAAKSVEGKKATPYETIFDEVIMYLTLGAVLIAIQTSVPAIVTKKTYPGCVRSFSGYPFDGDGDTTGLAYIACVARKGTTAVGSWKVLRKKSPETIMKWIKTYIDKCYITHVDVKAKINAKREYLMEHPDEEVLAENRVEQWTTFMPPLHTVRLSRIEPIVSGFHDLLVSDIKIGSSAQWGKMDVIQGKLIQFSLAYQMGVQQTINEVKGHRDSTDELFIDNFGSKSIGKTQHEYFSSINGDLSRTNAIVSGMHSIVTNMKRLSRALTIFCNLDDKNARAPLGNDYNEVTIYRAFISICRFNRQDILDHDLETVCGGKPDKISNSDAISEKIRKLKDEGKVYDGVYLEKLLRVSGAKNQVITQYDTSVVTQVQRLRNVITQCREIMNDENHPIAEIMRHLDIVLDTFDYDTYRSSPDVRALRNAISKQNDRMRKDITVFIHDHITMTPAQTARLNTFLLDISSWEEDASTQHDVAHSNSYYNLFAFINTYIKNLTTVFPHAIQHKVDHSTTMSYSTAKRNSLSRKAVDAINSVVESDYESLATFYDEPSIKHVLSEITSKCEMINKLAKHTPYFTEIPTSGDKKQSPIVSVLDKTTCKMLFEYYMLTTMHAYIELSADETMLNIETVDGYSMEDLGRRETSDIPSVDPGLFMSDMKKMRSTTARLLHQYVQMMHKHKSAVQPSYAKIMDTNFKIREGEKELITTRLANMAEQADRDLDNIKKANKQGVWGKGLQKSLRFHVKDDYDNEREFADKMQEIEQHIRTQQGVTDENISQYQDDYLADMDRQVEEDEDERDMSRVRGDDADGDPYGDEDEDGDNDEY